MDRNNATTVKNNITFFMRPPLFGRLLYFTIFNAPAKIKKGKQLFLLSLAAPD